MAFFLLLTYIVVFFTRPHEIIYLQMMAQGQEPGQIAEFILKNPLLLIEIALALATLFYVVQRGNLLFLRAPQCLLIVGLMFAIAMSHMAHFRPNLGSAFDSFVEYGKVVLIFMCIIAIVDTPRRIKILIGVVVASCMVMVLQGIMEAHLGHGLAGPAPAGWSDQASRPYGPLVQRITEDDAPVSDPEAPQSITRVKAFGFFNDPNDLALILVVVLPFLVKAMIARGNGLSLRILCLLLIIPTLYTIFLTQSRGGWMALGVMGVIFIMLEFNKKIGIVLAVFMLAAMVYVAPQRDDNGAGRLEHWADGNEMLKANPVFGVGQGTFADNTADFMVAHNSFIHCYAELGLFGYFFWLGLIAASFKDLLAMRRAAMQEERQHFYLSASSTLIAALGGFIAAAVFLSRTYVAPLGMLFACTVALREMYINEFGDAPRFFRVRHFKYIPVAETFSIAAIWLFIKIMR